MNAHKLASLAGMATMAASALIHVSIPAVFAQAGQGGSSGGGSGSAGGSGQPSGGGQTTGTPRTTQPGQPGRTTQPGAALPRTTQPGAPMQTAPGSAQDPNSAGSQGLPTAQPGAANGAGVVSAPRQRLFALDNSGLNNQLADTTQRLANFETQLAEMNQRLLTQLGQARQLSGQRRDDAMAEVMQQMLIQQRTLLQFLGELRVSLTGDMQNNGFDANGNPLNPDGTTAVPGNGNGTGVGNPNNTNPGAANPSNPGSTNPNANNPNGPQRLNPGRPTTNPNRLPAPPNNATPQNPSTPTTNPSRNGG